MDRLRHIHAAAADLAGQSAMPEAEVDERLARAQDEGFWRHLLPDLSRTPASLSAPIDAASVATASDQFGRERYFRMPPIVAPAALTVLNRSIDVVVAAGWPAVFAIVADAFWQCARLPAITTLLDARLGPGFTQASQVWVHVVPAVDGAGGWMPHFDGFRDARVTVWIALTDATLDNGCMYLVPPSTLPPSLQTMDLAAPVEMRDVMAALHGARALPAAAGGVLGWDFDVLHWGGRASRPASARRAMSLVFVGPGQTALADEAPLLDPAGPLPSFDDRLKAIALALTLYGAREPLTRRYLPLATRLLARAGP